MIFPLSLRIIIFIRTCLDYSIVIYFPGIWQTILILVHSKFFTHVFHSCSGGLTSSPTPLQIMHLNKMESIDTIKDPMFVPFKFFFFVWLVLVICWEYRDVSNELELSASTTLESVFSIFTTWVISFTLTHHWSSEISMFKMSCVVITKLFGSFLCYVLALSASPSLSPTSLLALFPSEARWQVTVMLIHMLSPLVTFSIFLEYWEVTNYVDNSWTVG